MKLSTYILLSLVAASSAFAENCDCTYCLGPTNDGVNAPVYPLTCNGDLEITISGTYWKPYQDGMEYAILNHTNTQLFERGTLINADFKNPRFDWDFGFQLGLGYNSTCDGWDVKALWTWFDGNASSHDQAEFSENVLLLPIWSDNFNAEIPLFASDIQTNWELKLNLIDIGLGRKFWSSPKVALHPHAGVRIALLDQDFSILHKGGSFENVNGEVKLSNDFKGAGLRIGFDSDWHFGCGWYGFGNLALSQVYGRFDIDHQENLRDVEAPFSKEEILDSNSHFRTTSLMFDIEFGIGYFTLLCDCDYAIGISFGWEQHLFLGQNQMWRVVPQQKESLMLTTINNTYQQRRGDLSTQGWTLKVVFDF